MKKYVFVLIFITGSYIASAQFYAGLGLNVIVPHQSAINLDLGGGGNINAGYYVNDNWNFSLDFNYNLFITFVENYSIKSLEAGSSYTFFSGSVRPFVGFSAGMFQERFSRPLDFPDYYQNAFGIHPAIGLMFDNDLLPGLKVKTELSYNYIFTDQIISNVGFNIGLKYYFKNKI